MTQGPAAPGYHPREPIERMTAKGLSVNAIESGFLGRARKGAAAVIIAMTASACSKEKPSSTADGDAQTVIASPVEASEPFGDLANTGRPQEDRSPMATVKVLEAGKPPRTKLRYGWRTEQAEQLVMDLRTSASAAASGGAEQPAIPLPPVHVVVAIDPRDVSAGGDLRYAWRVTSATVLTDVRAPSPVISGMRAEVLAIEHLAGTAVVTARGLAREVDIDPATLIDAGATGQMVEQIRQTLRDVAAPLPEEEVGRGARWQKQSQLDARQTQIARRRRSRSATFKPTVAR